MKKLIIDRKKWQHAGRNGDTLLLHPKNKRMCCLGFDALNEGLTEGQIIEFSRPEELEIKIPGITRREGTHFAETVMAYNLIEVNDDRKISEDTREAKITKLFAKIGREVEFIN